MAKISTKDIAQAIYATAKGKSGHELHNAMANATEFLVKKNLLGKTKEILEELEKVVDDDEGIVKAKVGSPRKLKKSVQEDIEGILKKRYKANEIILDLYEDKDLLGGIKIQVKDEVIDLSLAHKVHQLQNYLLEN